MKVLKILIVLLIVLLVALAAVPAALPSSYEVTRSVQIQAPATLIHPWIEDLKLWPEWSAWNKGRYPDMTYEYSGADKGVGAVSSWKSEEAGNGSMTITASDPSRGVWYDLDFEGMYQSKGVVSYEPVTDGTKVSLIMRGDLGYFARYFGLVMDRMMGPDFEQGLARLEQRVESEAAPAEPAAPNAPNAPSAPNGGE
jgi:hypothetical protein